MQTKIATCMQHLRLANKIVGPERPTIFEPIHHKGQIEKRFKESADDPWSCVTGFRERHPMGYQRQRKSLQGRSYKHQTTELCDLIISQTVRHQYHKVRSKKRLVFLATITAMAPSPGWANCSNWRVSCCEINDAQRATDGGFVKFTGKVWHGLLSLHPLLAQIIPFKISSKVEKFGHGSPYHASDGHSEVMKNPPLHPLSSLPASSAQKLQLLAIYA